VPVGLDQKQHVELARDIAARFNQIYGETFVVPEPYILQTGKKIYSLAEPMKKMSKSDENLNSFIGILDTRDVIIKKFKRAVTDSETCVRYAEGKDGINNLMTIYSCFTGKTMEEIEREFEGVGYGDFKLAVGEACADALAPIQKQYNCLMSDRSYMENILSQNADYAAYLARKMLSKVYRKVGFLARNK
jgi:tryptophanyl-tRNA synthetase